MNVSLTPELAAFVQDRVASGRYGSASEVVRAGLRLLEADERLKHASAAAPSRATRGRVARPPGSPIAR